MKSILLISSLLLSSLSVFAQSNFSFAELKLMDRMNEADFDRYMQTKEYKLEKKHIDSLLGTMAGYENKTGQTIMKHIAFGATTLGFTTNKVDTLSYVSAAIDEGYKHMFTAIDRQGVNSYYMKGQAVLIIRRYSLNDCKTEFGYLITVQNSE